jgi:hypothetical protein
MKSIYKVSFLCAAVALFAGCGPKGADDKTTGAAGEDTSIEAKIGQLVTVQLTADIKGLSENDRKMLPFMFQVADIMDELFWEESLGGKNAFRFH